MKTALKVGANQEGEASVARLHPDDLRRLGAKKGDILFVEHRHAWYGGLKSCKVRCGDPLPADRPAGVIRLSPEKVAEAMVKEGERVNVEKIL